MIRFPVLIRPVEARPGDRLALNGRITAVIDRIETDPDTGRIRFHYRGGESSAARGMEPRDGFIEVLRPRRYRVYFDGSSWRVSATPPLPLPWGGAEAVRYGAQRDAFWQACELARVLKDLEV